MNTDLLHIITHRDFDELLSLEDEPECVDLFRQNDFRRRLDVIRSSNTIGNIIDEQEIRLIWTAYESTFYDWADRLFSIGTYLGVHKFKSLSWKYRDHRKGDAWFDQEEDSVTEVYSVYEHFGLYEFRSSEWSGEEFRFGPFLTINELVDTVSKLSRGDNKFPFKILADKL